MAYGKIKADALIHDNGGSDVEVAISSIAGKADTASPTFTGTPAAPTAATGTNTTQIATTAFVSAANQAKADLVSPQFSGTPQAPNAAVGTNSTQIATTAFVTAAIDPDTAKTDVAQTYTAGQRGEVTTLTSSSGSVAIDFSLSNNFKLTLSEAVTAITVSNATAGQSGSIFIEQPSSGGPYAVGGWVAAFLFSGAVAPTITQSASKCDRVDYAILSATQIQVVWTGNY
jgi:hypothetical protein